MALIDLGGLRRDLLDYFGTAKQENPNATIDLIEVEKADYAKLIDIAIKAGFDLKDYMLFYDGD